MACTGSKGTPSFVQGDAHLASKLSVPLNANSLQACGQVPESKSQKRDFDTTQERHQLEALAHFARQEQRLRGLPVSGALAHGRRFGEARELAIDAGLEEIVRLRR